MKRTLLVGLIFIGGLHVSAQNWKTILMSDTTYFSAGTHASTARYLSGNASDSGIIRTVSIKGIQVTGPDTLFLLQRVIRDTTAGNGYDRSGCLDTLAPSWMGPHFVRKSDGTEYFFNSRMDTITIQTKAMQGDSWTLAKDAMGNVFKGTVTQTGILTIDGVSDSFKTIGIKAYAAGNPIPHWYNGMVLQITKHHGWTKTLDLYRFPNSISAWDYGGIGIDSMQHHRLPAIISRTNLSQQDIAWVYAPGNEWIKDRSFGTDAVDPAYQSRCVTHDSIISVTALSAGYIAVRMKRDSFTRQFIPGFPPTFSTTNTTRIVTDTVAVNTAGYLGIYDMVTGSGSMVTGYGKYGTLNQRCFIDTMCSTGYVVKLRGMRRTGAISTQSGCPKVVPGISGMVLSKADLLIGFGVISSYYFGTDVGSSGLYEEWTYSYLKLGGCIQGTKINVSKLGAEEIIHKPDVIRVYPNPATDALTVSSVLPDQHFQVSLRSITGQIIWQQGFSEPTLDISTASFIPGLYFLEVTGKEVRQSFKVLIQH